MKRPERFRATVAVGVALVGFAILLLPSRVAYAETAAAVAKLDAVLQERATRLTGRSRVIVEFNAEPDVRVFARGAAGRRVSAQAQVGEVENHLLGRLAGDSRVARVMVDRPAFPTLERTGGAMGATLAREEFGLNGRGVGIAIVDSGITSYHDDLYRATGRRGEGRVVHFKDFTRPVSSTLWATDHPHDDYGHGTHVAGIIAGNGYASRGARSGVAPGAHLIGLKVLDAAGHGYVSDVIAAIDYAIAIKSAYNVRILNLSVASAIVESYTLDPLTRAAKRANDAGIVVVAAAGNLGRNSDGDGQFGGITSPGNAPWVLTIGASSHRGTTPRGDDVVAEFSSRGPTWIDFHAKPDLVAPGVGIESASDPQSTLYATMPEYLLAGTRPSWYQPYLSLSGTSMAAPVVTGTIALMLQANPALTPNAVKAILQYTAQARPGEPVLAQGAGLLNARGAVRMARFFAAPVDGLGDRSDAIAGETVAWAEHIIWGNYRVIGGVPLPGSTAWALDITWGDLATPAGEPVIWGAKSDENIIWSTGGGDDNNIIWSTAGGDENIIWSTAGADENIIWSTAGDKNIIWSTAYAKNVVWGEDCQGRNCRGVIWGSRGGAHVWGTGGGDENIIWSTGGGDENIIWSTATQGQVVWPASLR